MERNRRDIRLGYGPMAGPLSEQITKQGFNFDPKEIEHFEKQRNAIHVLGFANLLTDSVRDKIQQKLHNAIVKHVSSKN